MNFAMRLLPTPLSPNNRMGISDFEAFFLLTRRQRLLHFPGGDNPNQIQQKIRVLMCYIQAWLIHFVDYTKGW